LPATTRPAAPAGYASAAFPGIAATEEDDEEEDTEDYDSTESTEQASLWRCFHWGDDDSRRQDALSPADAWADDEIRKHMENPHFGPRWFWQYQMVCRRIHASTFVSGFVITAIMSNFFQLNERDGCQHLLLLLFFVTFPKLQFAFLESYVAALPKEPGKWTACNSPGACSTAFTTKQPATDLCVSFLLCLLAKNAARWCWWKLVCEQGDLLRGLQALKLFGGFEGRSRSLSGKVGVTRQLYRSESWLKSWVWHLNHAR